MGWLFNRKKKVPKIPFPEAQLPGADTLRFPERMKERVIEPDEVVRAAGLREGGDVDTPEQSYPSMSEDDSEEEPTQMSYSRAPPPASSNEPLYVKVDVYQRILGEIGNLKDHLTELNQINSSLENSEYNEEANFDKLRKTMKAMHDRLLQSDKILFKS